MKINLLYNTPVLVEHAKRILVISNSKTISGAELSLTDYLSACRNNDLQIFVVLPADANYRKLLPAGCTAITLPLIFFKRSCNPFYWIRCLINICYITIRLTCYVHFFHIGLIYSNTIKAHVYGIFVGLLSLKKKVWHVRDNISNGLWNRFLISRTDKIICISQFVFQQVLASEKKKVLITGGIDTNKWRSAPPGNNTLKEKLGLPGKIKLVAQVSQLTPWKNHPDFLRASKIIQDNSDDVYFLMIGDILNSNDLKYKEEIEHKIKELGLENRLRFLGFRHDIRKIISQIDILVHPAINEPFGRILIETMAMQKPVVAYHCGGAAEIIENNRTGYLVEPCSYEGLAEKTIYLLKHDELRKEFGRAGRQRVIEKFNLRQQVKKIDHILQEL